MENIDIGEGKSFWGGEPAGNFLTDYLYPEVYTIYTTLSRPELMRKLRIVPATDGELEILDVFWNIDFIENSNLAPTLLVYADLMISGDSRNRETAEIIYEKVLLHHIEPN